MKIEIEGTEKEIADFVLRIQNRQEKIDIEKVISEFEDCISTAYKASTAYKTPLRKGGSK